MNESRTEEAFSLKIDSAAVAGQFFWSGNTLVFIPFTGFEKKQQLYN